MDFRSSTVSALFFDISQEDLTPQWGEVVAEIDDATVTFNEETGELSAVGQGGRIDGQAERWRVGGSKIVLIVRCDVNGRPTSWFLFGVSSEDRASFEETHGRWLHG